MIEVTITETQQPVARFIEDSASWKTLNQEPHPVNRSIIYRNRIELATEAHALRLMDMLALAHNFGFKRQACNQLHAKVSKARIRLMTS